MEAAKYVNDTFFRGDHGSWEPIESLLKSVEPWTLEAEVVQDPRSSAGHLHVPQGRAVPPSVDPGNSIQIYLCIYIYVFFD